MFFDGRGHNNKTGQESFFSIAHLFLYGGLTVLGVWIGVLVTRYQLGAADPQVADAGPASRSRSATAWPSSA